MLIDLTQNTVRRPSRACLFENATSTETTISRTNGMEKRKEVSKKLKKRQKEMRKRFTSAVSMLLMRSVRCAYERILLLL